LVPSSQTWGVEMGNSRIVSCPVVVTATISMPSHFRTSAESPAQSSDPWQRRHNFVGRPPVPSGSESVAVGWGLQYHSAATVDCLECGDVQRSLKEGNMWYKIFMIMGVTALPVGWIAYGI
jgi:hypothetical protein